ncbi:hypothetical protein QWZ13_05185 [Reinekea marina]|uniref:hypothetical protein n=1 Tax=Reinekea marina TaxID=1310421 RepID=UPI0025B35BAE|nr:hypothetical protein [Reinekea marina]MDN3648299.1 hypothetical protein [Reinekea marina]
MCSTSILAHYEADREVGWVHTIIHAPLSFAIHGSDTHSTHPHPQCLIGCHFHIQCCVGAIEACGDAMF